MEPVAKQAAAFVERLSWAAEERRPLHPPTFALLHLRTLFTNWIILVADLWRT
jgi:hypothetical protein